VVTIAETGLERTVGPQCVGQSGSDHSGAGPRRTVGQSGRALQS
jgi:hypothetical protein